jgi:glutathione S-transferase
MRTLYHLWLCPFARKVRIVLAEKKLPFELEIEKVWERRDEFLALNPAGEVPVLLVANGEEGGPLVLSDSAVISEYLEETCPEPGLLGSDPDARAEARPGSIRSSSARSPRTWSTRRSTSASSAWARRHRRRSVRVMPTSASTSPISST